jgi:nicotinate phosphoribosyltransferase
LRSLVAPSGGSLFPEEFLDWLSRLSLSIDVDAIPEGTVVFPNEPLLRVSGPLVEAQILESLLLNIVNFQTLVATKSARIRIAAGKDPVLEFGLRRAQGVDGALAASRAAYVGGARVRRTCSPAPATASRAGARTRIRG